MVMMVMLPATGHLGKDIPIQSKFLSDDVVIHLLNFLNFSFCIFRDT